mmetsp:Transcript_29199/g.21735  ORF Transcript_29199/g.21735 Transcript_29199/m.21735 type:complete len:80 (-) Transcript_29199:32-271(-)
MGSDGLFDNLFDDDILYCLKTSDGVKSAAKCIGEMAFMNSHDKRYRSPFAVGAQEAGVSYMGGKPDDITVLVSRINLSH